MEPSNDTGIYKINRQQADLISLILFLQDKNFPQNVRKRVLS
jgi:hypothetical protein